MLAALVGVTVALGPAAQEPRADDARPAYRVGLITLRGNTVTPDGDILDHLRLYPGGNLPSEADLVRLEMRLLLAFHKRFDLDDRPRPRIEVMTNESGSDFVDVLVSFPEKGPKRKNKRGG